MSNHVHIDHYNPNLPAVRSYFERCTEVKALSRKWVYAKSLNLVLKSEKNEGEEVDVYVSFKTLARALDFPLEALYQAFTYTASTTTVRVNSLPGGYTLETLLDEGTFPSRAENFMYLSCAIGRPVTVCPQSHNEDGDEIYLPLYTVNMISHK